MYVLEGGRKEKGRSCKLRREVAYTIILLRVRNQEMDSAMLLDHFIFIIYKHKLHTKNTKRI
jgi:hypothetical protein